MRAEAAARRRRALQGLVALLAAGCGAGEEPASSGAAEADTTHTLARIAAPAEDGDVHLVRMVARGERYAFEPDEVRVRAGGVVRFVHTGSQPEAVAFDTAGAPPGGAQFLQAANLVRGPLLTRPGQIYEVSFRDAPAGRYAFRSLPHGEAGMRGVVIVE